MPSAFVFEAFLIFSLAVARNELKCRLRLFLKFFFRLLIEVAKNELKCSPHLFVSVLGPVGIEPATLGL